MHRAVFKLAFILTAIREYVRSFTLQRVLVKLPGVNAAISPREFVLAVPLPIFIQALIALAFAD